MNPRSLPSCLLAMGMAFCATTVLAGSRVEWAGWTQRPDPVWEGAAVASDPSVVRDGGLLRMAYTAWVGDPPRTVIAEVVSTDGLSWTPAVDSGLGEPVVLDGRSGMWDAQLETPFLLRADGAYWLYFAGYPPPPADAVVAYGRLGLATSTDGVAFTRSPANPILGPTAGWYDNDAIFSPSVVPWDGSWWMVYAGHCWTDCAAVGEGFRILGAGSADGVSWTKHGAPVMDGAGLGLDWAAAGTAEPEIVQGPDGLFYLFFSAFSGDGPYGWTGRIGVARSPHPFGPWDVDPEPIVSSQDPGGWEGTETIAPSVLIEDGRVRLWYLGHRPDPDDWAIGTAEAAWPLMRIQTDWTRSPANPVALPFGQMEEGETDLAVADPTVVWDEEAGLYRAWWSTTVLGIYGPDGPPVMGIRSAESPDGLEWTVQRELAFSVEVGNPRAWDHTHAETPFVIEVPDNPPDRRWLLYYSGGNTETCTVGSAPCYAIGLAYSSDGKHFTRLPAEESPYGEAGLVLRGEDVLPGVDGTVLGVAADPTLLLEPDGTLRMWMSSYAEDAAHQVLAFGISHASSRDGIHWTPTAENPLPSLRRPDTIASGQQPSVLYNPATGRYEMWLTFDRDEDLARIPATLFQAFGYWHATSTDGLHWEPEYGDEPDFRWDPAFPAERWGLLTGVHVLLHGGEYRMYYSAWSAMDVPPLFTVPTQAGMVPAITALCLATRPAPAPTPRHPAGRARPVQRGAAQADPAIRARSGASDSPDPSQSGSPAGGVPKWRHRSQLSSSSGVMCRSPSTSPPGGGEPHSKAPMSHAPPRNRFRQPRSGTYSSAGGRSGSTSGRSAPPGVHERRARGSSRE